MTSETEKRNKMSQFQKDVIAFLRLQYGKALAEADATEIYHSVSAAAMCQARKNWGRLEEGKMCIRDRFCAMPSTRRKRES